MPLFYESSGGGLPAASQEEQEAGIIDNKADVPAYNALRKIGDGWALGAGGNDRGEYALDLQQDRDDESQVAGSDYSSVLGGYGNGAYSSYSAVVSGYNNHMAGGSQYAVICSGKDNYLSSAGYSIIGAGLENRITSGYSAIICGKNNIIDAAYAAISGGSYNEIYSTGGVIAGGYDCYIDANYSVIVGGSNNTIDEEGHDSVIVGGQDNYINSEFCMIGGGYECEIGSEADYSVISGGIQNIVTEDFGTIPGGSKAKTDKFGQMSYASGCFVNGKGNAQISTFVARKETTNNTPSELFTNGISKTITVPVDSAWVFHIFVVAHRTDADNESAGYEFKGVLDNNSGATNLVGAVTKTVLAEDTPAWDCNVTGAGHLKITATGENGKTIRWVARIELTEVRNINS